jgi:hypothetical protein
MIAPAHAEPAVVRIAGQTDGYHADQAWLAEGMLHALGRWSHREGPNGECRRLYGESRVRSWPTRCCVVEWSPSGVVADALLRTVTA